MQAAGTPHEGPRLTVLADLVDELVKDAEEAAALRAAGRTRGPVTQIASLDEALGGHLVPGVHLLQAAPGAGKTGFCLQAAADCGFPTLFVSAEMPVIELFRRVISRVMGVYLGKLKSGELAPSQVETLARKTAAEVPALAFLDVTRGAALPPDVAGDLTPAGYIATVGEALKARFDASGVLVIIDALQPWARSACYRPDTAGWGARELTEYELVTAGISGAGQIAAALASPVLCVSHRNRAGQQKGGLHAGKGSGDLEYAAETLLELTPTKPPDPETGITPVDLGILKNRHGAAGVTVPLQFEGRLQRFWE